MGRTFESIHPLQKNIWALLGCSCSPGKVKFWLWNSGLFSPLSPSHHIKYVKSQKSYVRSIKYELKNS
jgi:hypothetical protein